MKTLFDGDPDDSQQAFRDLAAALPHLPAGLLQKAFEDVVGGLGQRMEDGEASEEDRDCAEFVQRLIMAAIARLTEEAETMGESQ